MTQGYMIFHLNLAFSSIPANARSEVIRKCYWPLLDLAEETGIPVGIELTGWTLQQITELDMAWVERFKRMLANQQCELIGSGWSQLIGPLAPYEVNIWNQMLALEYYKEVLGVEPTLALVNEMAFSTGMVSVYTEVGYKGIILDKDNIRLALGVDEELDQSLPYLAKGPGEASMPVLWTDSVLFQKFQRVAHGDLTIDEYLDYFIHRRANSKQPIAVYSNDVEIFDYRPGRFTVEADLSDTNEWERITKLCNKLNNEVNLNWLLPSKALEITNNSIKPEVKQFTNLSYPIPVKKQSKYNVSRWAISGRDDLWINTICHRIFKHLNNNKINDRNRWKVLCELWASDYRTHITENRWTEVVQIAQQQLNELGINSEYVSLKNETKQKLFPPTTDEINIFRSKLDPESGYLEIQSEHVKVILNTRRGLTIHSLSFKEHNYEPHVLTVPHGYFNSINLSADYYSAGLVLELPTEHRRTSDLSPVEPEISYKDGNIVISAEINAGYGSFSKIYTIESNVERINLRYEFNNWKKPYGILRISGLTMNPDTFKHDMYCEFKNGGPEFERFSFERNFNHGKSASTLVSATTGLGATDGSIIIGFGNKQLCVRWNQEISAIFPFLQFKKSKPGALVRLFFSIVEMDETLRNSGFLPPVSYSISPFSS